MEPVLKWAGGKRQLLSEISQLITPEKLNNHTFFEPFVGGGSVFLSLECENVVINDSNKELINTYKQIKTNPKKLISLLKLHQENHCKEYYYQVRDLDLKENYGNLSNLEKAARTIYLNRTCFNGLYRVNASGHFNVPMGTYKNPDIVMADRILKISEYLKSANIIIKSGDFSKSVVDAKKGDVVYFDPPYDYEGKGFTGYTSDSFNRDDLVRLKLLCDNLIEKGCFVVISNNDTQFVNELFSDDKYSIKHILANRMINCNGQNRTKVGEVLIYG